LNKKTKIYFLGDVTILEESEKIKTEPTESIKQGKILIRNISNF